MKLRPHSHLPVTSNLEYPLPGDPGSAFPTMELIIDLPLLRSLLGMVVNGFTNLYLLTLEQRFRLSSIEVGFIAASNDVAGILLTGLVSFYGAYGNKIKWLGFGCFITGN